MYAVAVKRDFIAQHFLIGGDWGDENIIHSHHYVIELQLRGKELDKHGYLVDIVDIEDALDALIRRFKDCTLNDMSEFEGLNPSIEHFSRILCLSLADRIQAKNISSMTIKIWENDIAWASFSYDIVNQG